MDRRVRPGSEALPAHVPAEPGVHGRRRGGPGARDRREHRDLLGRERRAAQAGGVSGPRPDRALPEHVAAGRGLGVLAGEVRALPRADERRRGRVGLRPRRRQLHGRGVARAAALGPGVGRFLQAVRGEGRAGPDVHARRGRAERAPGRGPRTRLLGPPVPERPRRRREGHLAQREPLGRRRRAGAGLRFPRVRAGAGGVDAVPDRSEHDRSGALLPRGRAARGRCDARAGAGAAAALRRRIPPQVPRCPRPEQQLHRRAHPRGDRPQRAPVPARAGRRGGLRAAHRVRQRGQPAARARERAPPRNRDPDGHRRGARADRAAAARRERAAVAGGRRDWRDRRRHRHPRPARHKHRGPAARRSGRRARGRGLARARLHAGGVGRHGPRLRPDSGAAGLARGPQRDAQGERRAVRRRRAAGPDARGARRDRGRARRDPARGRVPADPHVGRAGPRGPGLRRVRRPDAADVHDRAGVREGRRRRPAHPERRRAPRRAPRRRPGQRHVLRAARRGLWPAVQRRRPAARRPVPGRRRVVHRVAGLLRGLQESRSSAAVRSPTATTARARPS